VTTSTIHSLAPPEVLRDAAREASIRSMRLPRGSAVPRRPATRRDVVFGTLLVLVFCGGFGAWSALAPLASATLAQGTLVVEGNRRTLQHLEGGIIREFLVRDGDVAREGDVLLRLDDTQTASTAEALRGTVDGFRALDARLTAERDGEAAIRFPADLLARRGEPRVAEILAGQQAIFSSRRIALDGQASILLQRVEQLRSEIRSYEAQMKAQDDQLFFVRSEIEDIRSLVEKGLERRPRLLALQRTAAQLVGSRDQQVGMIAKAEQTIGEAQLQLIQLRNAKLAEVTAEQRDLQARLVEMQERLRAATDVQQRRDVVAPVGGTVTNLRFHTIGGVVRPGEPLMDIVPKDEGLVVEVRVQPQDIHVVSGGMPAEIRLTALKQRIVPALHGKVVYVAADVESDQRTLQNFYRAKVRIDQGQMAVLGDIALAPGMPADVMIKSGERTLLRYVSQPLLDSFHRAFREQ
jgi:HlyD family secretion protein